MPPAGNPLLPASSNVMVGLAIRGPASDGSCAAQSSPAALAAGAVDPSQPVFVRFGEDSSVGCALSLTPAALAAFCASPAAVASAAASTGLARVLLTSVTPPILVTPTHIGQLGSSDPAKAWQWLSISAAEPSTDSAAWDPVALSCANVPATASLELLWAQTGQAQNPQPRILAARLVWTTTTWTASRGDGGAQQYALQTTVTWTQMNSKSTDFIPPAPPIIPPMPADLFYPFSSGSSGSSGSVVSGATSQAYIGAFSVLVITLASVALLRL